MSNSFRGEIEATIGGERRTLCLTLGALGELETRMQAGDLQGLAERLSSQRISARDLVAILGAGLRGGGARLSDEEIEAMPIEGGLKGAAEIVARLLHATFGEGS